jgi:hypothetical protein
MVFRKLRRSAGISSSVGIWMLGTITHSAVPLQCSREGSRPSGCRPATSRAPSDSRRGIAQIFRMACVAGARQRTRRHGITHSWAVVNHSTLVHTQRAVYKGAAPASSLRRETPLDRAATTDPRFSRGCYSPVTRERPRTAGVAIRPVAVAVVRPRRSDR